MPIESLDQEDVSARNRLDPAFGNFDSAFSCQAQHGVFNARVIPSIVWPGEFGNPECISILDDRLWTRAAHGGSEQQKLLNLSRIRTRWYFVFDKRVCQFWSFSSSSV